MGQVDRFSVSLDTELLAAFDRHISGRGYANRSEAVRDLIRDQLTADRLRRDGEPVVMVLSFLLDLDKADVSRTLAEKTCAHGGLVTSSCHFPLDDHSQAMVMVLRGTTGQAHAFAGEIQALCGVLHTRIVLLPVTTAI